MFVFTLSACANEGNQYDKENLLKIENNNYREDLKSVIEITREINNQYFTDEGISNVLNYEKYAEEGVLFTEERTFVFEEPSVVEVYEDYISSEEIYTVIYLNNAVKDFSKYYDFPSFDEGSIVTVFSIDKASKKIVDFNVYN